MNRFVGWCLEHQPSWQFMGGTNWHSIVDPTRSVVKVKETSVVTVNVQWVTMLVDTVEAITMSFYAILMSLIDLIATL